MSDRAGMPASYDDDVSREWLDDEPEIPDFDPGPECDDEGGMSEIRASMMLDNPAYD
jgi:hypothetical protein